MKFTAILAATAAVVFANTDPTNHTDMTKYTEILTAYDLNGDGYINDCELNVLMGDMLTECGLACQTTYPDGLKVEDFDKDNNGKLSSGEIWKLTFEVAFEKKMYG